MTTAAQTTQLPPQTMQLPPQPTLPGFEIRPIAPAALAELRQADDAGQPPRLLTDRHGGSPLRCCLRPSRPGEHLALVSYAPLRRWARETGADPGPYDEVGPVFIHPEQCAGPAGTGWPAELTGGTGRVLRGYSADGRIRSGRLVSGDQLAGPESVVGVLGEVFADPAVAIVHVRAVEFGCFTFEVRRG